MSSWGANTSDESKPKHLTDVEKNEVYANTKTQDGAISAYLLQH